MTDVVGIQPCTSYDISAVNNDTLPFFESLSSDINMSCDTALLGANSSSADVAEFIRDVLDNDDIIDDSTTLSVTMEHYSSAAAALNNDLTEPPADSSLTDTNALFQQLLRASIVLDDYENSTFLHRGKSTLLLIAYVLLTARLSVLLSVHLSVTFVIHA